MARRANAWKQEGIEPKAKFPALIFRAFEFRRPRCVEVILSSSTAAGRIDPADGHRIAHAGDRRLSKGSM
jgi:hypothetical protein